MRDSRAFSPNYFPDRLFNAQLHGLLGTDSLRFLIHFCREGKVVKTEREERKPANVPVRSPEEGLAGSQTGSSEHSGTFCTAADESRRTPRINTRPRPGAARQSQEIKTEERYQTGGETSIQPVQMLETHTHTRTRVRTRPYCCATVAASRLKPIKED